jgi:ribosomal protein S9
MQSSADTTAADQATAERAKVLVPFGLTERQARFLVTVILHSGAFAGRQYAAFAGITRGRKFTTS